jgi:hypothetical protein
MDPEVLQRVLDRQEITDTLYRYASTIDTSDYERLRELFADDAEAQYGDRDWMVGAGTIVDWIADHGRDMAWHHHLLSVYHVDIDGDAAKALTYHTSHQVARDDPDAVRVIVARYHDELRRQDGTWKITRKVMEVLWRETRHAAQAAG